MGSRDRLRGPTLPLIAAKTPNVVIEGRTALCRCPELDLHERCNLAGVICEVGERHPSGDSAAQGI